MKDTVNMLFTCIFVTLFGTGMASFSSLLKQCKKEQVPWSHGKYQFTSK